MRNDELIYLGAAIIYSQIADMPIAEIVNKAVELLEEVRDPSRRTGDFEDTNSLSEL